MEILTYPPCRGCTVYKTSGLFSEKCLSVNPQKTFLHLSRCEKLFVENDPADDFYCIQSGKFIITKHNGFLQEEIIGIANPGDLLGIDSIINHNLFNNSAAAIEDSVVCKITKQDFIKESDKHPELIFNLIRRLSRQLKETETHG